MRSNLIDLSVHLHLVTDICISLDDVPAALAGGGISP